jgi:hypothetical protein
VKFSPPPNCSPKLRVLCVFFLAALLVPTFAHSEDVELSAHYSGKDVKMFSYSLPREKIDRQQDWDPGTHPCPLPLEEARALANKWLSQQSWHREVAFYGIELLRFPTSSMRGWYYKFSLGARNMTIAESPNPTRHPYAIIVLFDKTFVEPVDVELRRK